MEKGSLHRGADSHPPKADGRLRQVLKVLGAGAALAAGIGASAAPVGIDYAGFWLDNVGANTLGISAGISTFFVAKTTPDYAGGTTGVLMQNGAVAGTLGISNVSGVEWVRRAFNPSAGLLAPIVVAFSNGSDSASFSSRSLAGLTAMPLVQELKVSAGSDPSHPTVSWILPSGAGDVDAVEMVYYDNVHNVEVGTRTLLPATATSYTLTGNVSAGYDLAINVRLVDLYDDAGAVNADNRQRVSRAFVDYLAPVPEPASWALTALGGAAVLGAVRRRRPCANPQAATFCPPIGASPPAPRRRAHRARCRR